MLIFVCRTIETELLTNETYADQKVIYADAKRTFPYGDTLKEVQERKDILHDLYQYYFKELLQKAMSGEYDKIWSNEEELYNCPTIKKPALKIMGITLPDFSGRIAAVTERYFIENIDEKDLDKYDDLPLSYDIQDFDNDNHFGKFYSKLVRRLGTKYIDNVINSDMEVASPWKNNGVDNDEKPDENYLEMGALVYSYI